jgi:hypothetical protein
MTVESIKPVNVLGLDFSMPNCRLTEMAKPHSNFIGGARKLENHASYPAQKSGLNRGKP